MHFMAVNGFFEKFYKKRPCMDLLQAGAVLHFIICSGACFCWHHSAALQHMPKVSLFLVG